MIKLDNADYSGYMPKKWPKISDEDSEIYKRLIDATNSLYVAKSERAKIQMYVHYMLDVNKN